MINNKQQHYDDIKDTLKVIQGLFEVALLTIGYYFLWKWFYRDAEFMRYYGMGKFVLSGIYFVLILIIFYLCDSFQYGHMRLTDIITSQWISIFVVDFITYFQNCLMANRMLNPLGMLLVLLANFAISFVCCVIFNVIFHSQNVPKKMIMIYGNDNAVNLKFKMDTRSDKYRVTEIVNIDKGFDYIIGKIREHDAVIINDVPAIIRNDILKYCYSNNIRTYVVPKISDIIVKGSDDITLFDTPLMLVRGRGLTLGHRIMKRTMDIVLCLIAMIPAAPVMLLIALAIKLEDHGPVFYRQKRVTIGGREFDILKFRSMIVDAEKGGYDLSMRANGKDPRITKVGNIIRACRVDELPQLLNILKGDMSIVGPRPERVENIEEYCKDIPEFILRTKVKGGLTGFAQVYGKYNTDAYDKLRLDLMYIENYSIFLDIKLIFMTLQILVKPESTEGFDKAEELEKMKQELLSKRTDNK